MRHPVPGLLPVCVTLAVALVGTASASAQAGEALRHFYPERREAHAGLEAALASIPGPQSARDHHELLSSRPHAAGTAGDRATIESLVEAYRRLGLEVETQELHLYLPRPVRGEVEIVAPDPMVLATREEPLSEDPYTKHPDLDPGWLGYSGSGEVTAGVVYASYGREEDFRRLDDLGVKIDGKIVLMRYGKLFRGFKVANAEAAGAAGAILYPDPEDQGWGRGIPYPEGGWYNGQSIQRGSVATLPYPGDPLTPGEPAGPDADRLSPERVPLPRIPAQPLGWSQAREILSRMRGPSVPDGWQGGLPFRYRTEGGSRLSVRLAVEQELELRETANVVARLRGTESPQELVILGCHHDAWSFGASDPNSGSVVLFEVARSFAELARRGVRPKRTLVFAHWAAEELGLQGSTEWVEARESELRDDALAYLNLDMAAVGTRFGAAASPSLAPLVREVAGEIYPERDDLADAVRPTTGGGSDHVPFHSRVGAPVASIGVRGADGSAYHTNYDTLAWYHRVVGKDYEGALQLARLVGRVAARLANADVPPLDPRAYRQAVEEALPELRAEAEEKGMAFPEESLRAAMERFRSEAEPTMEALWDVIAESGFTREGLVGLSWELRQMERLWLDEEGLPGRPWHRNLLSSPDPARGYTPWTLPVLRHAVTTLEDPSSVRRAMEQYERIFRLLAERFRVLGRMIRPLEELEELEPLPPVSPPDEAPGPIDADSDPGGEEGADPEPGADGGSDEIEEEDIDEEEIE